MVYELVPMREKCWTEMPSLGEGFAEEYSYPNVCGNLSIPSVNVSNQYTRGVRQNLNASSGRVSISFSFMIRTQYVYEQQKSPDRKGNEFA